MLDRLLTRPSVKDEGLARYFGNVWDEGVIGVPRCVIVRTLFRVAAPPTESIELPSRLLSLGW